MNELREIEKFLAELPGFDALDEAEVRNAARATSIVYYRHGSDIMTVGSANNQLHIVRSGAVELRNADDELVTRLAEGDYFGLPSLMNALPARNRSVALEDTLVYQLRGDAFAALRHASSAFDTVFIRALSDRLLQQSPRQGLGRPAAADVGRLVTRKPVSIDVAASIHDTATRMVRERVSAMLLTDAGQLVGIVTDRDFRTRVVAQNLSGAEPVASIMTAQPISLDAQAHAYEAALLMMQNDIHHLPITADGQLLGMVSRSDFMRLETEHPLYLVSDLGRQTSVTGLTEVCSRLPALLAGQIDADTNSAQLGKFITAITDAVTRQLLKIAEQQLGPPPCGYAWIALGSQARHEQSAKSDQDNALVLADTVTAADDGYFAELAKIVNDGLNACGYVYCPGNVMASNSQWRQPLQQWTRYFRKWITVPEEKALMHANIFFDLRCIAGDAGLVEPLEHGIQEMAKNNEIFLAMMTRNAMNFQPPLGFFRQFVLEKSGEHRDALDLKLHGIIPIVEIARIRSLAAGEFRGSTRNRLRGAAKTNELTEADAASLTDALDYIEKLRLEHQCRQMNAGLAPDNHLSPTDLSPLARQNLKAAFAQIRTSQAALLNRFHIA